MKDCRFKVGDIVQHFKRENVNPETAEYMYRIVAFAQHTENDERLVIYQALYPPYKTCARPFDMFCSEVDREKYPDAKQQYRFEVVASPMYVEEDIELSNQQLDEVSGAGWADFKDFKHTGKKVISSI